MKKEKKKDNRLRSTVFSPSLITIPLDIQQLPGRLHKLKTETTLIPSTFLPCYHNMVSASLKLKASGYTHSCFKGCRTPLPPDPCPFPAFSTDKFRFNLDDPDREVVRREVDIAVVRAFQ